MSERPELAEADRWQREAEEELKASEVIGTHDEVPDRIAGFHAHLAAEKALKGLLIRRGVILRRVHDLLELRRLLPETDASAFQVDDLDLLNPWSIDGRYPADIEDVAPDELSAVIDAAQRVVKSAEERARRQ